MFNSLLHCGVVIDSVELLLSQTTDHKVPPEENIDLVNDLFLSQEDMPQTYMKSHAKQAFS